MVLTTAVAVALPVLTALTVWVVYYTTRIVKLRNNFPVHNSLYDRLESIRSRMSAGLSKGYYKDGRVYFTDETILNVKYPFAYGFLEMERSVSDRKKVPYLFCSGKKGTIALCKEIERMAREASGTVSDHFIDELIAGSEVQNIVLDDTEEEQDEKPEAENPPESDDSTEPCTEQAPADPDTEVQATPEADERREPVPEIETVPEATAPVTAKTVKTRRTKQPSGTKPKRKPRAPNSPV